MLAVRLLYNDSLEISRLLLAHGAEVNVWVNENLTIPIMNQASFTFWIDENLTIPTTNQASFTSNINSIALINLLLNHGADVNALDNMNKTPLDYAMDTQNLHLMRLLIDRGANISLAYSMLYLMYCYNFKID